MTGYDPSLEGRRDGDGKPAPEWNSHYRPEFEFSNHVEEPKIVGNNGEMAPLRLRKDENHVTRTLKYSGWFFAKLDFHEYPFDSQVLEIGIESRSMAHAPEGLKRCWPAIADPIEWRGDKGHVIAAEADWLAEWKMVKIFGAADAGAPGRHFSDAYKLQLLVTREPASILWNMVFSL